MCERDTQRLLHLLKSVESMRPADGAPGNETLWFRGTVHGITLALHQIASQEAAAPSKPSHTWIYIVGALLIVSICLGIFR